MPIVTLPQKNRTDNPHGFNFVNHLANRIFAAAVNGITFAVVAGGEKIFCSLPSRNVREFRKSNFVFGRGMEKVFLSRSIVIKPNSSKTLIAPSKAYVEKFLPVSELNARTKAHRLNLFDETLIRRKKLYTSKSSSRPGKISPSAAVGFKLETLH